MNTWLCQLFGSLLDLNIKVGSPIEDFYAQKTRKSRRWELKVLGKEHNQSKIVLFNPIHDK